VPNKRGATRRVAPIDPQPRPISIVVDLTFDEEEEASTQFQPQQEIKTDTAESGKAGPDAAAVLATAGTGVELLFQIWKVKQ